MPLSEADALQADLLSRGFSGSVADASYNYLQQAVSGATKQMSMSDLLNQYTGPKNGPNLDIPVNALGGPGVYTSGLKTWLTADDLSGADGSIVSSWADKSPNGFTYAHVNSPVLKTNVRNGRNCVYSPGTSKYFTCTACTNLTGLFNISFVGAFRLDVGTTYATVFGGGGVGGGPQIGFFGGTEWALKIDGGATIYNQFFSGASWRLVGFTFDNTTKAWRHWLDNWTATPTATGTSANSFIANAASARAMNDSGASQPFGGWIGEIAYWTEKRTDSEMSDILTSLKNKWGF